MHYYLLFTIILGAASADNIPLSEINRNCKTTHDWQFKPLQLKCKFVGEGSYKVLTRMDFQRFTMDRLPTGSDLTVPSDHIKIVNIENGDMDTCNLVKTTGKKTSQIYVGDLPCGRVSPNLDMVFSDTTAPTTTTTVASGSTSDSRTGHDHVPTGFPVVKESDYHWLYVVGVAFSGEQDKYNIPGFDEKFIGTDKGGTIELHGKYKLPWAKLMKTVHKLDKDHGLIYRHSEDPYRHPGSAGFVVHVFNKNTGLSEQNLTAVLNANKEHKIESEIDKLETFFNGIEDGKIVGMAVLHTIVKSDIKFNLTRFFGLIEALTGSNLITSVDVGSSYAAITVKGDKDSTVEELQKTTGNNISEVSMNIMDENVRVRVKSHIVSTKAKLNFVEFESFDTDYAIPIIDIDNDARTWEEGDKILLTSTDFEWTQAEECTVVLCDVCEPNQIRAICDPQYTHFADVCDDMNMVDMRGEVGLLTRNIKIMGVTDGVFGGHIKVKKGFKNAHFEGLELTRMGQNTALGRYPIHFHMCEDVGSETYDKPSYIRGNSIHHTFARATTIHGTHGCKIDFLHRLDKAGYYLYPAISELSKNREVTSPRTSFNLVTGKSITLAGYREVKVVVVYTVIHISKKVQYNFVYDTLGHAIFLEDGGEKNNVIEWNLVGGTRMTDIIKADERASSFWITNPKTYVRNNIAFGSDKVGFWFVFPNLPIGPSRNMGFMEYDEAKHTAIYQFENNQAHSCGSGLFIDHILFEDTSTHNYNKYDPWQDPFNSSSGPKEVLLKTFTAFKNRNQNVWNRGSSLILEHCSLVDSKLGATLLKDGKYPQVMQKCIVIGKSCNVEENENLGDRNGFKFRNGPNFLFDTYFDNFTQSSGNNGGAILVSPRNSFTKHKAAGVLFGFDDSAATQNRVFRSPNMDFTKDIIASFRDEDGSVTGINGSQVVDIFDFFLTPDCKVRHNWLMAVCPNNYGELKILGEVEVHMARDDIPSAIDKSIDSLSKWAGFMVIPGGVYSYTIAYPNEVPYKIRILSKGISKSKWIRVGMCVPRYDATFDLTASNYPVDLKSMSSFTKVDTVENVENDITGSSYMYDKDVGILFVKLVHRYEGTSSIEDFGKCVQNICAEISITTLTGNRTDSYCYDRAYDKYKKTIETETATPYPEVIPASASKPPADWGAGIFQPFTSPPFQ